MSDFANNLLSSIKLTLRQSGTDVFDDEVKDYINTCATDLQDAGILSSYFKVSGDNWEPDPRIKQAVRWYCLGTFGLYNADMEKYLEAYKSLKSTLCTQKKYTEEISNGV